jgi:hypothetical protein
MVKLEQIYLEIRLMVILDALDLYLSIYLFISSSMGVITARNGGDHFGFWRMGFPLSVLYFFC